MLSLNDAVNSNDSPGSRLVNGIIGNGSPNYGYDFSRIDGTAAVTQCLKLLAGLQVKVFLFTFDQISLLNIKSHEGNTLTTAQPLDTINKISLRF